MKLFIEVHERIKTEESEFSNLRYIRASDVLGLRIHPDGRHQLQFWEFRGGTDAQSVWITVDELISNVARDVHDALTAKDDIERFSIMINSFIRNSGYIYP